MSGKEYLVKQRELMGQELLVGLAVEFPTGM
jgi:hypothetical protein